MSLPDRITQLLENLTTGLPVVNISNMQAELLVRERIALSETAFAEFVLWQVAAPVRGSLHRYRYRLALVEDGVCTVRYDNEPGKGDHRHVGGQEEPYRFVSVERLVADFVSEIQKRMRRK